MDIFWKKGDWESADLHLQRLVQMPFKRVFPFIPEKKGLYIIRGPRQIGKSSWLKTILSHYSRDDANKCFYHACDNMRDHVDLKQLLDSIQDKKIILLDEVTFVEGWDRAVKHFVDQGRNHVLVVTGSDANDLRRGADRMPGRFDAGGEYNLLPMDFHEFLEMRAQAGWPVLERKDALLAFFRTGGFPAAVQEAGPESDKTPHQAMDTCRRWLVGDIIKRGKQEQYLLETLFQIANVSGSQISLQTLASKTQMGSHHTAQEYIKILEDCFALRTFYAIDIDDGSLKFKKEKKFIFTDPMIYWIAMNQGGVKPEQEVWAPKLAEICAGEFLARRYDRVGYAASSRSGEVDFYKHKKWAIEVKWAEAAHNLSPLFKQIRVPEKMVWTMRNIFEELPAA
ncbi:MAG: hypothetical protein A2583_12215 [Bdellovibrionales bacterium RIFOXYD1_FULL_53_11]|nr:MAG: hypothetical protein A2583_12215 [Bdellovibrionales bacterium RIFOXYD1_FULL_53_11]